MDKPGDPAMHPRRFQQYMRSDYVVLGEFERVSKGIVDVRLGSGMDNNRDSF